MFALQTQRSRNAAQTAGLFDGGGVLTANEAKRVLRASYKPLVLASLSYVNLTDRECNLLILRFMRGYTQQEAAEELNCTVNGLQKWEKTALEKCCKAWDKLLLVQEILKAAR